jgi:class 3 adenylate cyclase
MAIYSFGSFRLDAETKILFRGDEPTHAGQRAVTLLRVLVERPGAPISKTELIDAAWPNLAVEESNLSVQIASLRRVLGEEPGGEDWIETLPRRGYRFVGPKPTNGNCGAPVRLPSGVQDATRPGAIARVLPLAEEARPEGPFLPAPTQERPAERRQMTILVCGLVGTTALSARLDAEEFRAVLEVYHRHCREVIDSHGGHVVSYLPDGLIAYFGEPLAREHDAENALRAGLALAASDLPPESGAIPRLEARIGIASGTVIMDQLVAGIVLPQRAAVGEAPNLAQQLKAAAAPGSVVVARNTRNLARGLFEYRAIGPVVLEGSPTPIDAWQVLRASDTTSRFDARSGRYGAERLDPPGRSLSPFVGRGREMDALRKFAGAQPGSIRVIDIVGEPGIGKSRLLYEFRAELVQQNVYVLAGSCWPDSQETAFRPFIEVVRRSFRLRAGFSEEEVARELEQGLTLLGLAEAENLGLLMNLLGLASPQGALQGLSDVVVGQRTRELLIRLVSERSLVSPLALLLEDLHWIDLASQQLLAELLASKSSPPLLIVATSRPEYQPPWHEQPNCARVHLEPLSASDTGRIAESRLASGMDASAVIPLVVGKAEGNPLFAEEIINYLIEQGESQGSDAAQAARTIPSAVLPASVQALLATRVDSLAPADKNLLQAASVIGRQFSTELLAAVTNLEEADLVVRLAALEQFDLVRRDESSGEFVFKHALVRDALYASVLGARRAELHLAIAIEIERAATRPIEVAEILAHHYARTDAVDKAIEFLAMAGRKSLGIYSIVEAERFLVQALSLARAHERNGLDERGLNIMAELARVLTVQIKVGEIIALVEPEMAAIETFVDNKQTPVLLYFFGFALYTRCRFSDGRLVEEKAFRIAERLTDARAKAFATAGLLFLSTATRPFPLEEMKKLAAAALAAADLTDDIYLIATVHTSIGWSYFTRGLMFDAKECAQKIRRIGHERRDGRSIAIGSWISAWADVMCEDYAAALRHGEECVTIATSPVDRLMGHVAMGAALVLTGRVAEGRSIILRMRAEAEAHQWLYLFTATDGPLGVAMVLSGEVRSGLSWLHAFIRRGELASRREPGTRNTAELAGLALAEVYISMLEGGKRMPLRMLLKNLVPLVVARIRASGEAQRLLENVMRSPFYDPNGMFRARIEFNLGRLQLVRKRADLARAHLERARVAALAQKARNIVAKIDAALASL